MVRVLLPGVRMRTLSTSLCVLSVLLAPALARPAAAQGLGVRAGISSNPDQFYVGLHDELGPVTDRLWFRPNLELGVGDGVTTTAVNFEFSYKFDAVSREWRPYVGGGPALNLYRAGGNTEARSGFNVLLGIQHVRGFFAEFKAGFADSPDVKFGVGYVLSR